MSWWNPVDDVKSAVKDAKHAVSDTISTGEKLASDAYKTAKDGVKGIVKTGTDAVKTGISVGSDVAELHFSDAFKDAGTGLWKVGGDVVHTEGQVLHDEFKGAVDLTKGALKVGGDLNKFAIDSLSAVNPVLGESLRVGEVFAESAINTGILQPLDGASQLLSAGVHELTGYKLPRLELHITPDTQGLGIVGRIAADAGDAAGFIAPLLVTGGATSALAGLSVGADALDAADVAGTAASALEDGTTAARGLDAADEGVSAATKAAKVAKFVNSPYKTALDGAIAGFVFTPSDGKGNILESRLEAAGVNAVTFGAMDGASRILSSEAEGLLASTDSGAVKAAAHLGVNATSGVVGGVANAESKSLLSGNGFASAHDVVHDAAQFAITGTAMAGVHLASQKGFEAGANFRSRTNSSPADTTPQGDSSPPGNDGSPTGEAVALVPKTPEAARAVEQLNTATDLSALKAAVENANADANDPAVREAVKQAVIKELQDPNTPFSEIRDLIDKKEGSKFDFIRVDTANGQVADPEVVAALRERALYEVQKDPDRVFTGVNDRMTQAMEDIRNGADPKTLKRDLTNAINPDLTPEEKAAALQLMAENNLPMIKSFIDHLQGKYPELESESGIKRFETILQKAVRPNKDIDVENISDGVRFKTKLDTFANLPDMIKDLQDAGFKIISADDYKSMLKDTHWRGLGISLQMPDGQIAEYQLTVQELEKAFPPGQSNHADYEFVRDFDSKKATPAQIQEYIQRLDKVRSVFDAAWEKHLQNSGLTEDQIKDILADVQSSLKNPDAQ